MTVYETVDLANVRYERRTEWRRDLTIPWDLAFVTGTLTEDIGPNLLTGMQIYGKHTTRSVWAELLARKIS